MEIWKDIKDYEGLYQVSNHGNILSLPRYIKGRFGGKLTDIKRMKLYNNAYGYKIVILTKDKQPKTISVHRLVANAFIPNPENKPQVNHKDCVRTNNNLSNLEWVTAKENMRHAVEMGRCDSRKNGSYEIKKKHILEINMRKQKNVVCYDLNNIKIKEYVGIRSASRETNIDAGQISACCKKKYRYKTAGGYKWEYVKGD